MKVNLEAGAAQGGILPEGEHAVIIADAADQVSKKNNPMIVLDVIVDNGQWEGAEVRDWIVPSFAQGVEKFIDLVQSTGLQVPKGEVEFEVAELIGRRCRVVVFHDTYDGKKKAKVSAYKELQEGDAPSADKTSNSVPF